MHIHSHNTQENAYKIFVAGATGAIGFKLCLILKHYGYQVYGSTRSLEKAKFLEAIGVEAVILDVFNHEDVMRKISHASPDIIIHQLTDLPYGLKPEHMEQARKNNAKIREIGTKNLLEAASATSCKRFIAQSIAFAYLSDQSHYIETTPLNLDSENPVLKLNALAIHQLEKPIQESGLDHVILRYGKLYGPATGMTQEADCSIHVDAAAFAACQAINKGMGIYNIVDDSQKYSNQKAKTELGFNPSYRWKLSR